jgi:hypothetical protein
MLRRIGLWKDANVAETFIEPKPSSKRPSFNTENMPANGDPNLVGLLF